MIHPSPRLSWFVCVAVILAASMICELVAAVWQAIAVTGGERE